MGVLKQVYNQLKITLAIIAIIFPLFYLAKGALTNNPIDYIVGIILLIVEIINFFCAWYCARLAKDMKKSLDHGYFFGFIFGLLAVLYYWWWKNGFMKKFLDMMNNKYSLIFLVMLFDVLFAISYVVLNLIWNIVFPSSQTFQDMLGVNVFLWLSSFIVIIYILIIALLYSVFKYIVLYHVKSFYREEKFEMKNFFTFFLFNISVCFVLFAYYMALSLFAFTYVGEGRIGIFGMAALAPILFFFYPFFNLTQMTIVNEKKIKLLESFKRGFGLIYHKFIDYLMLYLLELVVVGFYVLVFFILTALLNLILFKDNQTDPVFIAYQGIFIFLTFVLLWLLLIFNRIYLNSLIGKKE